MKTKLLLSTLFTFVFYLLSSQIPQGFNYQAIARDASGNPIINTLLPVRITIQSDSLGGTICWIEEHSSVTTNGFGLFTLILGKGVRQTGSTVATFNDIDWTVTPKFIKTEINYSGWKTMGSSRLWAVPYSMVSSTLAGPLKKLAVTGETSVMDEALFEVKNKNGQTVFAVYNEGVRVYVDDGVAKGVKGGFAIGGFGTTKTTSQSYFVVDADSIRAYIDTTSVKGKKGGFAIGGFDKTKAGNEEYLRITRDSTRIYVRQPAKGAAKGGFAIGGFDRTKGPVVPFVDLTPKNYFIGHEAGLNITTGLYNSFLGYQSGRANKDGNYNIFIGYQTGFSTLGPSGAVGGAEGSFNCYVGHQAGYLNLYGANNTAIGYAAGYNNISDKNTFLGSMSGYDNTSGYSNTFIGTAAGHRNSTGSFNVFLGRDAGNNVITGTWNTLIGSGAGANISSGEKNIIIGSGAMGENYFAGSGNGSSNIIIGFQAGYSASNSSSNIFIGNQAGFSETGSNKLYITNSEVDPPLIYGDFSSKKVGIGTTTPGYTLDVNGTVAGQGAFTSTSDKRYKKDIQPITEALSKVMALQGITFNWDRTTNPELNFDDKNHIGFSAQDIEKVLPQVVNTATDKMQTKSVAYGDVVPVLVEAIKEQQQQIESTKQENLQLKSELQALKEKMEQIEAILAKSGSK